MMTRSRSVPSPIADVGRGAAPGRDPLLEVLDVVRELAALRADRRVPLPLLRAELSAQGLYDRRHVDAALLALERARVIGLRVAGCVVAAPEAGIRSARGLVYYAVPHPA